MYVCMYVCMLIPKYTYLCIGNVCFYICTMHIQHNIKFNNPRKHKITNLGYPSRLRRKSATSFLMPGSPLESLYAPSEKTKGVFWLHN